MCGLTGIYRTAGYGTADLGECVSRMAQTLSHRGPDDQGFWSDESSGIALAHRRLSILDLSPSGTQPMASADGRWMIAFNGEIYNHLDLRNALEAEGRAPPWRGRSDTETLLASVSAWGVAQTLQRCSGMFAVALWDRQRAELWLARDRFGEKPLYYRNSGGGITFASELKALRADRDWQPEVDRAALAAFLRLGYVPAPWSIYTDVKKLPAGSLLRVASATSAPEPERWWRLEDVADGGLWVGGEMEAETELERLLEKAIARQSIADVPLGAFLSGGIDSSTVVALMQKLSSRAVRTFSIGFRDLEYDEAPEAGRVARHLGTDHTEFYVSPADAMAVIPRLSEIYDEPFGDSSQIPTHLVASVARQHVTVALSGDGGDELFGGYNRYVWGRSLWRHVGPLPLGVRRQAGRMLTAMAPATWDRMLSLSRRFLPASMRLRSFGDKLHKLGSVIVASGPDEFYQRLISQQREPETLVIGAQEPRLWADEMMASCPYSDLAERMMYHDLLGYLSDDILAKVDRAAMAVSLETRVPMLDQEVAGFAMRLPLSLKIRGGKGKWLLRRVLHRYIPPELVERPKQGFAVPLDAWLRGPLRPWADALLDEARLRREGFLKPEPITMKWQEHLSGRHNWQHWLWNVLMFQAWRERWL